MKLYIKQQVFSFGDKYQVYDETGNVLYYVEGDIFTLASKLHVLNTKNEELFLIKKRLFTFLPKYDIYQGEEVIASADKRFTFLSSRIDISSKYGDFTIDGEVFAHDFSIYQDGNVIASIQKKWLSWGDTYEIEILDNQNVDFFVALVITIDNCMHNNKGHSSSSQSHHH